MAAESLISAGRGPEILLVFCSIKLCSAAVVSQKDRDVQVFKLEIFPLMVNGILGRAAEAEQPLSHSVVVVHVVHLLTSNSPQNTLLNQVM